MNFANRHLPPSALTYVLPVALLEVQVLRFPQVLSAAAGRSALGGWLAGVGLTAAALLLSAGLAVRFPGLSLAQVGATALGGGPGRLLAALYSLFWLLQAIRIARLTAELVRESILPHTPTAVVALGIALVCTYAVWHGVEPVARLTSIVLPFGILLVTVFLTLPLLLGRVAYLWPPSPPRASQASPWSGRTPPSSWPGHSWP